MSGYSHSHETELQRRERLRIRESTIPDQSVPDEPTLGLLGFYDVVRFDLEHLENFIEQSSGFTEAETKRLDRAVVLMKTGAKEIKRILKHRKVAAPSRLSKAIFLGTTLDQ